MPLLFLYRKKARSARLFACKRAHDGSLSLPPFCENACGTETLDFTVFFVKSCKNTHTMSEQVTLVPIFYIS